MTQLKGPLLIAAIVCAAFLWGYQGDSLKNWFNRSAEAPVSPEPPVQQQAVAPPSEPKPVPPPASANYLSVPFPQQGFGKAPAPGVPANPYAALNKAASPPGQSGSLAQTMDSINSGQIQDEQVVRRNAYFEKLAEQLKELRGESPPPTAPPSPSAEPATEAYPPFGAANPPIPGQDGLTTETPHFAETDPEAPAYVPEPPPLPPPPELSPDEPPLPALDDDLIEEAE